MWVFFLLSFFIFWQLFGNFEDLIPISAQLVENLNQQEKKSPENQTLGSVFSSMAAQMKDVYVTVCANQYTSLF